MRLQIPLAVNRSVRPGWVVTRCSPLRIQRLHRQLAQRTEHQEGILDEKVVCRELMSMAAVCRERVMRIGCFEAVARAGSTSSSVEMIGHLQGQVLNPGLPIFSGIMVLCVHILLGRGRLTAGRKGGDRVVRWQVYRRPGVILRGQPRQA